MSTLDPRYAYKNQSYYNSFKSEDKKSNENAVQPVAVTTNDKKVNFGDHEAAPFVSKLFDFVRKLATGEQKSDNKDTFIPYYA